MESRNTVRLVLGQSLFVRAPIRVECKLDTDRIFQIIRGGFECLKITERSFRHKKRNGEVSSRVNNTMFAGKLFRTFINNQPVTPQLIGTEQGVRHPIPKKEGLMQNEQVRLTRSRVNPNGGSSAKRYIRNRCPFRSVTVYRYEAGRFTKKDETRTRNRRVSMTIQVTATYDAVRQRERRTV